MFKNRIIALKFASYLKMIILTTKFDNTMLFIFCYSFKLVQLIIEILFLTHWFNRLKMIQASERDDEYTETLFMYWSVSILYHSQITALAKQLDWSERQVERWLRLRRSQDRPSTLTKFCENRYFFIFTRKKYHIWTINSHFY